MQLSSLRRALRPWLPCPRISRTYPFSSSPAAVSDLPTRPWEEALDAAQRAFSLPLAARVLAAAGTGNAAVSPVAVHSAVALAATGSRGPTRGQLLAALGGGDPDAANVASRVVKRVLKDRSTSGGPRVAFAGGVWADASVTLRPGFVEAAGGVFNSAARTADFKNNPEGSRQEINKWINEATKNTITSLVPAGSINQNTRLILGNALYFRGRWLERDDMCRTSEEKFNCLDGAAVQVPFMVYDRTRLLATYDGFKVIKLPYKQGKNERKFAMYIFLPDARDGIFGLTEKIISEPTFLDRHLPTVKQHVEIRVPKFMISCQIDMKDFLKEMGLELPFLYDADFSDMVKEDDSSRPLFLSGILHKAIVEVEKGAEAAAMTMGGQDTGKPLPVEHFIADHPFIFVIREDTSGAVIFMGHVLDPAL